MEYRQKSSLFVSWKHKTFQISLKGMQIEKLLHKTCMKYNTNGAKIRKEMDQGWKSVNCIIPV